MNINRENRSIEDTEKKNDSSESFVDAIETLEALVKHNDIPSSAGPHIYNLKIVDGKLVSEPSSSVGSLFGLTAPLFSQEIRDELDIQTSKIKGKISDAVDVVRGQIDLISIKLQEGNPSEKKRAEYALDVIGRYNKMVSQKLPDDSWSSQVARYLYEKNNCLLNEKRVINTKRSLSAQNVLIDLGKFFKRSSVSKSNASINTTHKKPIKAMLDAFQIKAMQALKDRAPVREIVDLIKNSDYELDDDGVSDLIWMHQLIEYERPGKFARISGAFNRRLEGKLMSIPLLSHFRCTFITYSRPGYPSSDEHSSFALSPVLIDPNPLRSDQTPLFNSFEEKLSNFSERLINDPLMAAKVKKMTDLKREAFDQNRAYFVDLHRKRMETIATSAGVTLDDSFERYYLHSLESESTYNNLSHSHQYWIYHFINKPAQHLRKIWLEGTLPVLRKGTTKEKYEAAVTVLENQLKESYSQLSDDNVEDRYIRSIARLFEPAVKNIILKYMSDKIGLTPPIFNLYDIKVLNCTFGQAQAFCDELEVELNSDEANRIFAKHQLEKLIQQDIRFFNETNRVNPIIEELDNHFNADFYNRQRGS